MKSHLDYLRSKTNLLTKINFLHKEETEVFIKRLISTVFFISCSFTTVMAKTNLNLTSIAMAKDIPFSMTPSAQDQELGKEILNFHNDLEKFNFSEASIKKIITLNSRTQTFKDLEVVFLRFEAFAKIQDEDTFFNFCTIAPKKVNDFTENSSHRLDITGDRYCRNLFLKNLLNKKETQKLSQRENNFFKEALAFYINQESTTELVKVINHFKKDAANYQAISDLIIQRHIELEQKPATLVMNALKSNAALTKFLKENSHLDKDSASFFQDEFQKLNKSSQEAIDAGTYDQAKQRVHLSLEFFKKNKKYLDQKRVWTGLNITAKQFFNKGQDKDAIDTFNIAKDLAPKDQYSEAIFNTLWPHLVNQDYPAMKKVIDKSKLESQFDKVDSKVQFWVAYALYKTGNKSKANEYFHDIINASPYSFYSIIALKEMAAQNKNLSEEQILAKLITNTPPVEFKEEHLSDTIKHVLTRLSLWNTIGSERFATLEQRHLQTLKKSESFKDKAFGEAVTDAEYQEFVTMNLIRLLNDQEKYLTSFKVFQESLSNNSLSMNYKLMKYIFPLSYFNIIEKNSLDIDPIIVISLIRQESAFNPNATSRVGAKGLMQLMPATAKRMNKKVTVKNLNNPEVNVSLGTKYLRQLFARFDGNLIYTLASYNAGENRIDRWKKDVFRNDDPLATIESIPYEETRNYVKLIYRNHFFYSLLNNKSVLTTPLNESFKVTFNEANEVKTIVSPRKKNH